MLAKITLREIKSSLGRYLAVFAIIALGVGFFAGLRTCRDAMIDTANDYLVEHNLHDYEIMTTYGIDDKSVGIARNQKDVVAAEGSIQHDIIASYGSDKTGQEMVLKAISMPESINTIKLCAGRFPTKPNECVIDNYKGAGSSYRVGDTIKISKNNEEEDLDYFKYDEYQVVGKVNTPLYLDYERGTTKLSNGELETYFYITEEGFDTEYYTNLYIKLKGNEYSYSDDLKDKLDSHEDEMEALAETILKQRREDEKAKAQDELDDGISELNDSIKKFNKEVKNANNKLNDSQKKIDAGRAELERNASALRKQLAGVKASKNQLEQAHAAGYISDEEYTAKLAEINAGIAQINAGLELVSNKRAELDRGQATLIKEANKANKEFSKAKKKIKDADEEIADAKEAIDDLEEGKSYTLTREDNQGYATFEENANIVSNIAKIFPLFFLLVAALVCMTTMTRMIDEQRSQVGTLKAVGYSDRSILIQYLTYSGSASLLGALIGFFAGCKIFPTVIWRAYTMMYNFDPDINYVIDWKLGAASISAALLCSMGATWFSCNNEFHEMPASLIRPETPRSGKKILLEKFTLLWSKLSFLYKVSLRNVFRYKKRFIMMVLGICGCTALLVAGFGINTSIRDVAVHQYDEVVVYDYEIIFDKVMDVAGQKGFLEDTRENVGDYGQLEFVHQATADIEIGGKSKEILLMTSKDRIDDYFQFNYKGAETAYPGQGEILACRKLHDQQGLDVGETVIIRDGDSEMKAVVSGFYDSYIDETIYMTEETYIKGMGHAPDIKTAFVKAPSGTSDTELRELATDVGQHDDVAATVVNQDVIDRVDKMMASLNSVIYVVILCAGLLAFIVLYNLTNINILERIREIATIKVLGFYPIETTKYVFRENIFLTGIAAIIGLPLGKWLLDFVMDNIRIKTIFFVTRLTPMNYLVAFLLTFVFAFIVNIAMWPRLNKISMTESLKSIE